MLTINMRVSSTSTFKSKVGVCTFLIGVALLCFSSSLWAQPPAALELPAGLSQTQWQQVRSQIVVHSNQLQQIGAVATSAVVPSNPGISQQAYIKGFNTEGDNHAAFYSPAGDLFAWSIALSADGNTLAVGAYAEDSSGGPVGDTDDNLHWGAGAVYVFIRTGSGSSSTWSQQAYIKGHFESYDYFGSSVALSGDGNTLAVGVEGAESFVGGTPYAGHVQLFVRSNGVWNYRSTLTNCSAAYEIWGQTLALNGDGTTLAVGTVEAAYVGFPAIYTNTVGCSSSVEAHAGSGGGTRPYRIWFWFYRGCVCIHS